MININYDECTACGACVNICPQKCIILQENVVADLYPYVDTDRCINCDLCNKVCHINNEFLFPKERSEYVYAAYSLDSETRLKSASGGIASSIYKYCLLQGIHSYGVKYIPYYKAEYIEIKDSYDIDQCRNSKYMYSDMNNIYIHIKDYLNKGERTLFIGLPCQVAGLISFLHGRDPNLITVDIICHGTCSDTYFNKHLKSISKKHTADKVLFRDPAFGTQNYMMSMYENHRLYYKKKVQDTDVYQIGYHKALFYRNCCYKCRYTRNERISDLTISDFCGLGKIRSYDMQKTSVSCIICNTNKGEGIIQELMAQGMINRFDRPADEAYRYERKLSSASVPHPRRQMFIKKYIATKGDFEKSAKSALRKDIIRNQIHNILHVETIKYLASIMLPKSLKQWIKQIGE